MFRAILRSAAANARRLLYIWLVVLVANQLFIFRACFAPYCLAAAVPHTLAIAILLNFFGFERDDTDKKKPVSDSLALPVTGRMTADATVSKPSGAHKSCIGLIIACVLIAGVVVGLVTKNGSRSLDARIAGGSAAIEPIVDVSQEGEVADERLPPQALLAAGDAYEDAPDERMPEIEPQGSAADVEIPDERASLAQRYRASRTALAGAPAGYVENDDEFDINDIEQYERLHKTKYRGTTDRTKQVLFEDEEADARDASPASAVTTKPAAGGSSGERRAAAQQRYRCVSSSGWVSDGIGRASRDSEYSAFLGRSVHAGEFVIFKYERSPKAYWFRSSNCQLL